MLQETKTGQVSMQMKNYDYITSKSKWGASGCMILVSKRLKAQAVPQLECGRIIACKVNVEDELIGLVNVYAPSTKQERRQLWECMTDIEWDLWGGLELRGL